jgi:hypothetical protein
MQADPSKEAASGRSAVAFLHMKGGPELNILKPNFRNSIQTLLWAANAQRECATGAKRRP